MAVLSHGLWQRRFGGDPAVVGQVVRLDGAPVTVAGVAEAGFAFPAGTDLWLPLQPSLGELREVRGVHNLLVLGRLAPGVSVAAAQREMAAVMERLEAAHPEDNRGRGALVEPLADAVAGDVRTALLVLLGAVTLVLLVACVNVANLVLARAQGRGREMALRSSVGASRWRLGRLLLVESLVLALTGGAATAGTRRSRLQPALVIAEVALAVALVVAAGLLLRSLDALLALDPRGAGDAARVARRRHGSGGGGSLRRPQCPPDWRSCGRG